MRASPLATPDIFDIQSAADDIIGMGRLTEMSLSASDAAAPVYDGEDWNVLVQSDLRDVARVKGDGAILVQGSVFGSEEASCRIEIGGNAVICGDVRGTSISAANIYIGGDVVGSQLTAAGEVRIGSDLGKGRVVVGNYEQDRKHLETCRMVVERSREQAESLGRRVGQDGKRMDKACRALRIPLDFSVGQIVQHSEGKINVDLTSLYRSIGDKQVALDTALGEFFARGVVGVIARTNRKYLVNYPAREKVFLQLLKSLRELFVAVLERDEMLKRLSSAETELENLRAAMSERGPSIAVRGRIAPETEMEFILPRINDSRDGGFDFAHKTAQLCVRTGGLADQCEMVLQAADGERSSVTAERDELEGLLISIEAGKVRWTHVAAAAVGGV